MLMKEENMANKLLILGAGGMAREVYEIYKANRKENLLKGFLVKKNESSKLHIELPLPLIHALPNKGKITLLDGIGSPLRRIWIEELINEGYIFDSAIHSSAIIASNSLIGEGSIIAAASVISVNVKIGSHTIINIDTTISHDSSVGDFSTLSPGVNIGGRVKIGAGTFIGIGTSVIQDVHIGSNVIVGSGSNVISDLPDNILAYGNPAKIIRRISDKDWRNLF
jgi:sugar O-acyltransferase (sialic acid O-acetyltransferase NeuD family)